VLEDVDCNKESYMTESIEQWFYNGHSVMGLLDILKLNLLYCHLVKPHTTYYAIADCTIIFLWFILAHTYVVSYYDSLLGSKRAMLPVPIPLPSYRRHDTPLKAVEL